MSRIYTMLRLVESGKRGRPNGNPLFNILKEKAPSGERKSNSENFVQDGEAWEYPAGLKKETFAIQQDIQSIKSSFIEMAGHLKDALESMRAYAERSQGKFKDVKVENDVCGGINGNIDRMVYEIDWFLNFIRIKSRDCKTNRVHDILEELLKNNENKLRDKKIKIAKKQYDRDLPETSVRDEQLRYILNWLLQYTILSVAPNENIGIVTKPFDFKETGDDLMGWVPNKQGYVEIQFTFHGWEKRGESFISVLKSQTSVRRNGKSFILPLAKEIVHGNHELINIKVDHEKQTALISLVLPVKQRKVTVPEEACVTAPSS